MRETLQEEPPRGYRKRNDNDDPDRYLKCAANGVLYKFTKNDNAREFSAELQSTLTAFAGEKRFERDASRSEPIHTHIVMNPFTHFC